MESRELEDTLHHPVKLLICTYDNHVRKFIGAVYDSTWLPPCHVSPGVDHAVKRIPLQAQWEKHMSLTNAE